MDKTEIKENEWTACHLQGTMMHSHGRCIKVVYAREEDHPLSGLASLAVSLKPRRIMKVVKRLNR